MPGWMLLCIGSAGHGFGVGKGKASGGGLSTNDDIADCKSWFDRHKGGSKIFGTVNFQGETACTAFVKETLDNFFKACYAQDLGALIYYTGHGDSDGDWRFNSSKAENSYIRFREIRDKHHKFCSNQELVIYSDCCYSGVWVDLAKEADGIQVIAAAGRKKCVNDRQFAKAVFKYDAAAIKHLDKESHALANTRAWLKDGNAVIFHKGTFDSTPSRPADAGDTY